MDIVARQLKELILDDNFTALQNLASDEVNLMEILGVSHRELSHSNFLAWLFDPNESHKLDDYAIKEFIRLYFKLNEFEDLGTTASLSVFDFVNYNFDDLEIRREYKNIDLILLSKKNQLCIVIENKIYSSEKKGQLTKYREFIEKTFSDFKHKIYIYLSFFEQDITLLERQYYVQLDYSHIITLIEQILATRKSLIKDKTEFVLLQYLETLKSMTNKNEPIEKIAEELYRKYRSAFDLVYKYSGPANFNFFQNKIKEWVESNKSILVAFPSNKTYIRFQPKFLYDMIDSLRRSGLISTNDDLKDNWMFLFEFNVRQQNINFDFKIGDSEIPEARIKLYKLYKTRKDFFQHVELSTDKLSAKWHLAFQKRILSGEECERFLANNDEAILQLMNERLTELLEKDLPVIKDILQKSF